MVSPISTRTRPVSAKASAILEHLARERRTDLVLPEDRPWLREIAGDHYHDLLYRMTKSGVLYRANRGRYVVAPRGSSLPQQAAAPEAFAALRLRTKTDYYVAFLSALVAHGLTDVQSPDVYVAVPADNRLKRSNLHVPGHRVKLVSLSGSRWPAEQDIETVRTARGSMDTYKRSTIERTLVDALARPDHSGGIELVVEAWGRANRDPKVDWERVALIGRDYSAGHARRVAFMLAQLGRTQDAELCMAGRPGRGTSVPLDRSDDFRLSESERRRDPRTGVSINVPAEYLHAWLREAA